MSRHVNEGYRFNIVNGAVSAVWESRNGQYKAKHMDADEVWTAQGDTVTRMERDDRVVEITTYADTDGDGVYARISTSSSHFPDSGSTAGATSFTRHGVHETGEGTAGRHAEDGYRFNIANGVVTGVWESENGRLKASHMDADEVWTVQANAVIRTEYEHGRLETTTYTDGDGDGLYVKAFSGHGEDNADHVTADTDAYLVVNASGARLFADEDGQDGDHRFEHEARGDWQDVDAVCIGAEQGIDHTNIDSGLGEVAEYQVSLVGIAMANPEYCL